MFSIEDLTKRCKGQNYRDLQKAAKSSGIKANLKKEELCEKIATFLKRRKSPIRKTIEKEDCNKLLKAQILDKVYKQPTLTRAKSYYQKMKKADLCNLLESKPKSRSLPADANCVKGSKSPVKLRSKSPVKLRSKSPVKLRSKSPSKSPVKSRSKYLDAVRVSEQGSPAYRLKGKGFTPVERSPGSQGSPYYSPLSTRGITFYGPMTPEYNGSMGIEITSPMSPMLDVYDFD